MSARNSWTSYKIPSLITFLHRYQLCAANPSQRQYYVRDVPFSKVRHSFSMPQGLRLIISSSGSTGGTYTNHEADQMMNDKVDKLQPPVPPSSRPKFSMWAKWILGPILTILLPFWQQKLKTLLRLKGEAEEVVEEVENVAEVVEKVATTTEKMSAEVADKLPVNGKLKEAALYIEHVSSAAAKDAQVTLNFIHKIDELKQDLKDLETFVEPVIDKLKEEEEEEEEEEK